MLVAVFATHVLLDALTVYSTQIFWPLPVPASWATIFGIDSFYTVPLLLGVLAALILRRTNPRGRWLNGAGLVLSTLYLVWSIGAKLHVNSRTTPASPNRSPDWRAQGRCDGCNGSPTAFTP